MQTSSPFADSVRRAFRASERGVIGLVDDLLAVAHDHDLDLEWHAGKCRVRGTGTGPAEVVQVAMPLSVFRAVLARVSAVGNERVPGSVSPYGGDAELATGFEPVTAIRVSFMNTPDEQWLRLVRIPRDETARIPNATLTPDASPVARQSPASGS